jgi:dienelactone hydrolase
MLRTRLHLQALSLVVIALGGCAHAAKPVEPSTPATAAPALVASAEIATQELSYEAGDTQLKGFLAFPASATDKRPGILVGHEWWGLNEHARTVARKLAELGYVALALDMYGDGKNSEHPADAKTWMMAVMADPNTAAKRFEAAKAALAADPHVDPTRLAAIGYCMGGALVLQAARRGDDLDLVASFHGNYATPKPLEKDVFKGKIFVAHGAADSFTTPAQVQGLKQELDAAGANYEFVEYAGAKHGFTNPNATELGKKNGLDVAYDAKADAESWSKLQELLSEAFR